MDAMILKWFQVGWKFLVPMDVELALYSLSRAMFHGYDTAFTCLADVDIFSIRNCACNSFRWASSFVSIDFNSGFTSYTTFESNFKFENFG